jgi:hypothetical protein
MQILTIAFRVFRVLCSSFLGCFNWCLSNCQITKRLRPVLIESLRMILCYTWHLWDWKPLHCGIRLGAANIFFFLCGQIVNFGFRRNWMGSRGEGGVYFSWPLPVVKSTKSSLLFALVYGLALLWRRFAAMHYFNCSAVDGKLQITTKLFLDEWVPVRMAWCVTR